MVKMIAPEDLPHIWTNGAAGRHFLAYDTGLNIAMEGNKMVAVKAQNETISSHGLDLAVKKYTRFGNSGNDQTAAGSCH